MSVSNPNPEDGRNLVFTVTTPTLPLTSAQYLLKLIQSHSHYQVIPAPLMLNYDADEMVMTALPLSKNKLIDLTLPLIIADSTGNEVNYLGRYLIYDQRLVGIRLCSSRKEESYGNGEFKKWRFGRISRHRVAKCISDYYKKQKFAEKSYNNQIPIGDFTLTISDIKICLLFQSQIQDSQATLIEYKRQGCEIFSIVCDIPRDQVFQATMNITNVKLSTKNQNMFRRFIRQNNRLMIYAGARIATKDSLFLANSFIIHPELPEKCIEPFFFNDAVTLSVICNIELFKRPGAKREKYSESKVKPELHIMSNLITISCRPGKSAKFYPNGQIEQTLFSKTNGDLLKKMKLWCIYQIDNQRTPFILPIPLSQKMEEIVSQLQKLSQYLGKPLSSILILYKKNKEAIVSEDLEESLKVELYEDFDDLCKKCSHQHLNIYTDDHSHYLHLTSRVESYKRVRLHYDYLKFNDDSGDRKAQVERISRMNDFASHVIKKRIIGYQRLLIESRSEEWRLSKDEQVQAIAVYLKSKLRSEVNNHPFYKSILFRSTEEIRAAMIEAEAKLANSQTSMADESILDNAPAEEEPSVNSDNNLEVQLKEMRRSQSKQQKRQNVKCHRCCCLFQKSLLHRCSVCRTDVCLVCIQEKQAVSVKTKQALIETAKCFVCRKLCNCLECLNKEKIQQSRSMMDISANISQTNQQQKQKQAIEYRDYCTVCLINQRKNSKIKVSCSTCDREECLACIRSQKRNTTITLEWQCSICKPYVQPPPVQPMISEDDKAMEVQEPARKPSKSKSNSRSVSPPKKPFVRKQPYNNNNRQSNFNNNNSNNFKSNWNQNRPNNNFNKGNNNSNANEDKKSRSVSRSASPVRKPINRANNEQKRSASRSNSPKRNVQNNKKNSPQRSPSRSKSPPKNKNQPAKVAEKKRSPSRSNSPVTPPRNTQKQKPKSPPKSPSRSKSPVKAKANIERKGSNSRSVTPPRNRPAQKKKSRSRSVSKSKSPPRKAPAAQERKKSVSRSASPPKDRKNARKSVSKSRSRSRERSRDDNKNRNYNNNNNSRNNNQPQPERLWNNDRPRENKWNNNNNGDGNNGYNRDRNQNYQNNRGGYQGNRGRGGYQNNYNRNNDRNNQGEDGNNRRYNNNNYNNRDNNNSYNNRDNNRNNNTENNPNNNQLLEVSNFEVNNDVDY